MRFLLLKLMATKKKKKKKLDPKKVKRDINEALNDIEVEEFAVIDDDDDPDYVEIIVTGRFKKGAFKGKAKKQSGPDPFDSARPF